MPGLVLDVCVYIIVDYWCLVLDCCCGIWLLVVFTVVSWLCSGLFRVLLLWLSLGLIGLFSCLFCCGGFGDLID